MSKKSEEAISRVVEEHAEAWDRHDMTAYAALFTEDADLVNIRGGWWQGRAQIEERMSALHKTVFRESRIAPSEVAVRFLHETIAIVHVQWELTGVLDLDGQKLPQASSTLTTWTVIQRGNIWLIAAFQNTEIAPPRTRL
jgi:uncharacterized protein (TIGR02246 family)